MRVTTEDLRAADPVRRRYDSLACEYDARWRSYVDATVSAALPRLQPQAGQVVVEVGAGTGELLRRLDDRDDYWRIGCDLSRAMLLRARKKSTAITWLQASADRLPLADQSADWVVSCNSFHYFRGPSRCLAEARRVLRRAGRFVLVDWCDDYWSCKLCSLWLGWSEAAFYRTYSLADCQTLVEQAGLRVVEARRFKINWLWGLMALTAVRD